jgi:hypothetical protein
MNVPYRPPRTFVANSTRGTGRGGSLFKSGDFLFRQLRVALIDRGTLTKTGMRGLHISYTEPLRLTAEHTASCWYEWRGGGRVVECEARVAALECTRSR